MIASNANSKADSTGSFEQIAERRDSMAAKRWTITTDCGDVVARFESGEEAWGAFCSDAFLGD